MVTSLLIVPVPPQADTSLARLGRLLRVDLATIAGHLIESAAVVMGAFIAYRLLRVITQRIEKSVEGGEAGTQNEQRAKTLAQILNSVGGVVIAIAAGLTILNFFIAIGPLLAGVGVAGLAVSFGAQNVVKDVISGFFILLENQFRVGDVVEINGVGGVVERMSLRVVMLRDIEAVLHIIPNGSITMVSNKTRGWSRCVLDIGVAYKEDVDHVMHVMREVAVDFWSDATWKDRLLEQPAVWGIQTFADSSVHIRMVAPTRPGKHWEVGRELRRRLKNRFDREGIQIPFPQRMLHLDSALLSQLGAGPGAEAQGSLP